MSYDSGGMSLEELAGKLDVKFRGRSDLHLTHACGLDSLSKGGVAYLTDPRGLSSVPVPAGMDRIVTTDLGQVDTSDIVFIVPKQMETEANNLIYADDPLDLHVKVTRLLSEARRGRVIQTHTIGSSMKRERCRSTLTGQIGGCSPPGQLNTVL